MRIKIILRVAVLYAGRPNGTVFRITISYHIIQPLSLSRPTTLILALGFLLSGCATQKSREDRSALNKFYHNTTAYYNGYFNANVLYEQSVLKLAGEYQDNYIRVLDVYDHVDVANPESVAADVDRAIEKLSVVVALHRHSQWTDDSYLLVGKSQYLKHDFESAEETLEYMKEVYSPDAVAQRKKTASRKALKKARDEERKEKRKVVEKEKEEKKKATEKAREEKIKQKEQTAKERRKEAERKQKERRKEAKERAKARKKGQKPPPRTARTEAPSAPVDSTTVKPVLPATPEPEKEPAAETAPKAETGESAAEEQAPERPNYFLKHRPAYAEGLLWLGRTYTERQLYEDALRAFRQAGSDLTASPEVLREIPVATARLFLKQERYDDAVPYLQLAIAKAVKKRKKARYHYILGQIYQRQGRLAEAAVEFRQVRRMRPGYEMDFNARLNLTLSEWMAGSSSPQKAREDLEKMLKDKKNAEYKDRIYFALADVDLRMGDTLAAIEALRQSLAANSPNKAQKAETQLKLADMFYAREQFIEAKTYYDQAIENLASTDERHERASRLSRNLTEIAKNLEIIALQDSLLQIASLSEEDRIKLAEAMREKELAEQEKMKAEAGKKQAEGLSKPVGVGQDTRQNAPAGTTKSTFFAYDAKTLERGMKDFRKVWGDRPLTDNWRQASKAVALDVQSAQAAEESVDTKLTKSELEQLFKDVPADSAAIAATEGKIQDAMMALGRLYRERLEYNEKSVEVLEELLSRFPETRHELDAWYFLYLSHKDLGHRAEAGRYYDLIVSKYPESTYARVLADPEYLGESKEKERKLNDYYSATYSLFQKARYAEVWSRLEQVDTLFGKDNRLQAKFAMLRAMTTGSLQGRDAYIDALKDFVAKYPNTEEETRAREILRLLGDKSVSPKDLTGQEGKEGDYTANPDDIHYIIINWDMSKVSLEDAQKAVNEFNRTYFKEDRLRLSANIFLNVDQPLMVIRKFDNAAKAMAFHALALKYPDQFIGKGDVPFRVYPVTQGNYRVVLKNRSLEAYDAFFQANYQ